MKAIESLLTSSASNIVNNAYIYMTILTAYSYNLHVIDVGRQIPINPTCTTTTPIIPPASHPIPPLSTTTTPRLPPLNLEEHNQLLQSFELIDLRDTYRPSKISLNGSATPYN